MMGDPHLCLRGAVSGQTLAQQQYALIQIAILDLGVPAKDRSHSMVDGETLLRRHRNQLRCPLVQGCNFSVKRMQNGAVCQTERQRWGVSQAPSLRDCRVAPCQCLLRKAPTKKDNPQKCL